MTATTYNFDEIIHRRGTNCAKHDRFDEDIIPLWVADMDFRSPQPVMDALHQRVDHGVFGYSMPPEELKPLLCQRMAERYNWEVSPDEIIFHPGVISAFNVAIRACGRPGDNVLMQPPVYPPFLSAPRNHGQTVNGTELIRAQDGSRLHYEIDFDAFEQTINPNTSLFLLCSPHNPVGRVWTPDELARMAEICLEHDVIICSDEIHCELVYEGVTHTPIASLSPEITRRTVTLMAPSKTFNLPSLGFSFAIIQDDALREQFQQARAGLVGHVSVLGYAAALAAYRDGDPWLEALLSYLEANRDYTAQFIEDHLPGVSSTCPEGTYLTWIDLRDYLLPEIEANKDQWIDQFLLKEAQVALNRGAIFGTGGEGFVRLNFATSRDILTEGLERIRTVVETSQASV